MTVENFVLEKLQELKALLHEKAQKYREEVLITIDHNRYELETGFILSLIPISLIKEESMGPCMSVKIREMKDMEGSIKVSIDLSDSYEGSDLILDEVPDLNWVGIALSYYAERLLQHLNDNYFGHSLDHISG